MTGQRQFVTPSMSHLSAPRGTHWLDKATALCAEVDPELFFPVQGDWASTQKAKALCAACPLQPDCLANADEFGTWGGKSERERVSGASKDTCSKGHDLTKENARAAQGRCRQCHRDRQARYDAEKRAANKEAS